MNAIARVAERPKSLAAEVARRAEERAEALVPGLLRRPVVAHDGTVLRGPRVESARWRDPADMDVRARAPREIAGFRVVDTMQRLYLDGDLTATDMAATTRLEDDYEIGEGARPGYARPEVGSESVVSYGPDGRQLDALARYRAAVQAIGLRHSAVLLPVVLANAEADDLPALRAALDALAAHYDAHPAPDAELC